MQGAEAAGERAGNVLEIRHRIIYGAADFATVFMRRFRSVRGSRRRLFP